MIIYLCSCGFATDDADCPDAHLDEHPGHYQRRMARDSPGHGPVPAGSRFAVSPWRHPHSPSQPQSRNLLRKRDR